MSSRWWGRAIATGGTAAVVAGGLAVPAQASAVLVFSVSAIDFGSVTQNSTVRRTVTLTNTGDQAFTPWRFDVLPWAGPVEFNPGDSTCQRNQPIPAQSSCTLALYTMADDVGSLAGSLAVVDGNDAVAASVAITGQVVAPPPPPANPKKAQRVALAGNRSEISWSKVADATSYEVQSSGHTICEVQAPDTNCISDKAWGQWVNVFVMAHRGASVSDGVEAKYTPADVPVTFATLQFSTKSASLNKSQRAEAVDAAEALIKQGWHTNITVRAGTKPGRSAAAARARTVRSILVDRWNSYKTNLPLSTDIELRSRGNAVKILVQ